MCIQEILCRKNSYSEIASLLKSLKLTGPTHLVWSVGAQLMLRILGRNRLTNPIPLQVYNWLWIKIFPFHKLVAIPKLKSLVYPTIYPKLDEE